MGGIVGWEQQRTEPFPIITHPHLLSVCEGEDLERAAKVRELEGEGEKIPEA